MTFFASWRVNSEVRGAVLERFVQTQATHPEGVRILGRWHRTDGSGGFMVVEAASMRPLTEFAYQWNDLLFVEIIPVVTDAGLMSLIEKLGKTSG